VSEALVGTLLVLLAVLALIAVRAADLLLATIALGAYGFVMSMVWAALGAVDVAFTEAVVGAGATTLFFLAALLRTSRRRSPAPNPIGPFALVITLAVGALLLTATRHLPPFGDPTSPPATHVSPRYLERTLEETRTPNAVTSVLADYRSYDTLIETVVIFTAGLGCWLLLTREPS
jgi:multicomponent Na+:H+ antiporter subunit B